MLLQLGIEAALNILHDFFRRIGAYGYSAGAGKAYLYRGGASGLTATASWTAAGAAAVGAFGFSVATAGDVNGDGYSDVVVGEYGHNSATGNAYVFLGGVGGLSASASWTGAGEFQNNRFGWSAGTAGDVNGDGYSDLLVGAYGNNSSTGKAYMYLGGPSGPSATASWTAVRQGTNSYFAGSVATGGDVNGDGYSDVLVGASQYLSSTGKAYLYRGGPNGLSASSAWMLEGEGGDNRYRGIRGRPK